MMGGSSQSEKTQRPQFQPIMINTQQFGELWVQLPPIEQKTSLNLPNVANAQIYANLIKNLQFNPVDIINNEVISAG